MGIHRIWTRQRPIGGIGASIKNEIGNAIALTLTVIACASELCKFLPKGNKQISMYSEEDVQRYKEMLPSDLKFTCKLFEISSIHEINFPLLDDNQLSWKKVSADTEYTNTSFTKISSKNTRGKDNEVETLPMKFQKWVFFSPEKRKHSIWYLFNSCIFHFWHCIFINKMF